MIHVGANGVNNRKGSQVVMHKFLCRSCGTDVGGIKEDLITCYKLGCWCALLVVVLCHIIL
jgi:hypothetical protein